MNKILIVEDEEFLVRALKDNLEVERCTVDTAMNGDEAIERIKKQRPDLILLDLLMPKKDGFYVLEEIKKNPEWKLIPVIILSNLGGDAEIKRALEMGADDYFVKSQHPIEEVIEKVKEYLEGGRRANSHAAGITRGVGIKESSPDPKQPRPADPMQATPAVVNYGSPTSIVDSKVTPPVITYILEAKKSGLNDEAIRKNLREAGWQEQDIDNTFNLWKSDFHS